MENIGIVKWLSDNKQWLFSGIGVVFLSYIAKLFYRFFFAKKRDKNQCITIKQYDNRGKNNTQIGIQNNYYNREKKDE